MVEKERCFWEAKNYGNNVRIVKTRAELDLPKKIKTNSKTLYNHRYKKKGSGTAAC